MANIPLTNRFHTTTVDVPTANLGSKQANSDRESFSMQDVVDTVGSSGGATIAGSITVGQIAFGAATANSIEGNSTITTNGTNIFIPDFIVHQGDINTFFGFYSTDGFRVVTDNNTMIEADQASVKLHEAGVEKIRTTTTGVKVTGQMDLAALNAAPATATSTGTLGEIRWVADAVYLCVATNVWVKADLATF